VLSASGGASDLYDNFFRLLMRGVEDRHIHDPGPYRSPPQDYDIDPVNFISPPCCCPTWSQTLTATFSCATGRSRSRAGSTTVRRSRGTSGGLFEPA